MRSGGMQIWKVPAEGGQPAQVTQHGGFEGFESADGRLFYYKQPKIVEFANRRPRSLGQIEHKTLSQTQRIFTLLFEGIISPEIGSP